LRKRNQRYNANDAPPQNNLNLNRKRTSATEAKIAAISPATTQNPFGLPLNGMPPTFIQHGKAILAAFALLHPKHHALGVNVADLQRDNLHGPQAGPVSNAERRLVLGTGGRLQQA
jgi:hypothetical protein